MNRNDIIDLLTVIAAGDRRTVGNTDVDFWANIVGDIPKDLALEAVRRHFRERPGVWLEPGHIVQCAREIHRERLQRESDEMREARQAALDARLAELEVESPPVTFARDLPDNPTKGPRWVRCQYCHAHPGESCVNRGRPELTLAGFHPARETACTPTERGRTA